jgi:hypothetical protein
VGLQQTRAGETPCDTALLQRGVARLHVRVLPGSSIEENFAIPAGCTLERTGGGATDAVVRIVELAEGRAFGLFTSYRNMTAACERLAGRG